MILRSILTLQPGVSVTGNRPLRLCQPGCQSRCPDMNSDANPVTVTGTCHHCSRARHRDRTQRPPGACRTRPGVMPAAELRGQPQWLPGRVSLSSSEFPAGSTAPAAAPAPAGGPGGRPPSRRARRTEFRPSKLESSSSGPVPVAHCISGHI